MAFKRDSAREKEAMTWISEVVGEAFPPHATLRQVLRDGTVLCRLMNTLSPGSIRIIHNTGYEFKLMENINNFNMAARKYGVPDTDLFQTVDLWEGKDIAAVLATIYALGRTTYKHPEWKGPYLGPRPAEEQKREWSEEQLRAGEGTIGLQAGTNKGASQSGQNYGAARRPIFGK